MMFRQRDFALMLLSQFLAYSAIWTSNIALLHVVYTAMESSLGPGLLLTAQFLPAFLLMPVASRVIGRYGPRRTVLASTMCSGTLALIMPFWSSTFPIAWFFAFYVLYSASITMFIIAGLTLLPLLVGTPDLARANRLLLATPAMMMVLSGASFIAQSHIEFNRHSEFLVVAALFFGSALVFSRVGKPDLGIHSTPARTGEDALGSFCAGLRYLFRHPYLTQIFVIRMALYIGVGGQVLLALYSEEFFGHGVSGTGLLYMARGLAMLLGAFGLAQLVFMSLPSRDAIAVGLAIFGLGYLLASALSGFGIAAVALLLGIGFLGEGLLKSTTMALLHEHTPQHYMARVMAAEQGLSAVIQSAAALAIAACVVSDMPETVLLASAATGGLLISVSLIWFAISRFSRARPRPHPDGEEPSARSRRLSGTYATQQDGGFADSEESSLILASQPVRWR